MKNLNENQIENLLQIEKYVDFSADHSELCVITNDEDTTLSGLTLLTTLTYNHKD